LYRLTAADYSNGAYFHHTYDAVGNRQTEVTQAGSTSYGYDVANRLTSVGGVTYTWDNNGNLLNDGASTNSYNHANRLATVVQGSNTYSFGYNGLGDRLRQTINGGPTTYTVDLAAGLTQVLAAGTNSYLYGVGRIGEEQPGGWQYHLGDALGSVRQLTNTGAAVTLARSYEPYGDALASAGSAATVWQFTGEARDATGLTYLRARYYASAVGSLVSMDPWRGDSRTPRTLNRWSYVLGNPVNDTDASGLGFTSFVGCYALAEALKGNAPPGISVGDAIKTCRQAYDMAGWEPLFSCGNKMRRTPTTVLELFQDFVCEQGPDTLTFHATNPLTRELARSVGVHLFVRRPFYASGDVYPRDHLNFNEWEGLLALIPSGRNYPFTINQFIGSFEFTVRGLPNGRVGFRIDNATERASGSHFGGRHRDEGYEFYLEDLIMEDDPRWDQPLSKVVRDLEVISILAPRTRDQTIGSEGGGQLLQSFVWSERPLDCSVARLPLRASDLDALLDIRTWNDYALYTDPWYGE